MASTSTQSDQEAIKNFWADVNHLLEKFGFVRRQATSDRPGGRLFYLTTFVSPDGVIILSVYSADSGLEFGRIIHGPIEDRYPSLIREIKRLEGITTSS